MELSPSNGVMSPAHVSIIYLTLAYAVTVGKTAVKMSSHERGRGGGRVRAWPPGL